MKRFLTQRLKNAPAAIPPKGRDAILSLALGAAYLLLASPAAQALELIIGRETVPPGVSFVFEGTIKDEVTPAEHHLDVAQTDVHIEALVNWSTTGDLPDGAPRGGFVPYLRINAVVTSQTTGESVHATLLPHLNLIDSLHYARNIALPSGIADKYEVVFHVHPPDKFDLAFHKDWVNAYGASLLKPASFRYRDVDFEAIAKATRN